MTPPVRTRFAPSPTGMLHIGGARTALFAWAFARHHGGQFILRIEDTDLERSTSQAVAAILDGMQWLGLDWDEGPVFQTQRMPRYREVIGQMLEVGTAYRCYTRKEELDALRAQQEAAGEKPRYDGRWRPEPGKTLPPAPADIAPVVRFKNPSGGIVAWDDAVKGRIEFANSELDDFIIARSDGSPTYNFCVVVDDLDMRISHVIRGDDHVNNTPRQINVLQALGGAAPVYAHLSMILGDDGQKLSKRRNAVAVTDYAEQGFLPAAVLNYLARLGWAHGDDEVFDLRQFVQWFDLAHITASAAQFNTEKLRWLNGQYMKQMDARALAGEAAQRLNFTGDLAWLATAVALYQERTATLVELTVALRPFIDAPNIPADLRAAHLTPADSALADVARRLTQVVTWDQEAIAAAIKATCAALSLKMPQVAIPLRVALFAQPQTPAIDAMIAVLGRAQTCARLQAWL